MDLDEIAALDLRPRALREPVPDDIRIGMVGLGRFVNNNVLPAYRARGYNVVAGADPDEAARERARSVHRRRERLRRLPRDARQGAHRRRRPEPALGSWHVARPGRGGSGGRRPRESTSRSQSRSRRRMRQCVEIVEAARRGGVKLAVNQNSRYAPAFFAAGEILRRGDHRPADRGRDPVGLGPRAPAPPGFRRGARRHRAPDRHPAVVVRS